ncbi:sugar transporter [Aquabacterium olei]|uniref:TRAP transporter small permease protein n=1 Tax=Aquabacterium olei TaxID=1296669 RepID=A0A2U8FSC6_9BURK|nr:TRAP transporter small permease subunit [Aquabacterium olei]AWI53708.1 sugar transporter [Aquabacterium olei]
MHTYIRLMDGLARALGVLAAWALLLACAISAGNATLRYAFSIGSNAWLEAQWYLFALAVFAGAPMLLKLNEHVRVDVLYGGRSPRTKAWIDVLGLLLVLLPVCVVTAWMAWPFAVEAYVQREHSPSAGGLLRWPVKVAIPVGFALLALQGLAELFKRVAYLRGDADAVRVDYERPLQ